MEFNVEEKVLFAINYDPLQEDSLQLLKACESLIEDFNSKYLATVVSRIRGMERHVFIVPYFIRRWTSSTQLIGMS
jgi:hypothetical protein